MVIAPLRICDLAICYIECMAVREDLRKNGNGRQAVCQVREYLRTFLGTGTKLEGMYIVLGMSRVTKPHKFFESVGLNPGLPADFKSWTDRDLDMAFEFVQPVNECDSLVANCEFIAKDSYAKFQEQVKVKQAISSN